jgi:hypothetical protein
LQLAGNNPRRSRKRGQRSRTAGGRAATASPRPAPSRPTPPEPPQSVAQAARSRTEERNAAVRRTLTPLAPDERPWPIVVGALLSLAIAVSNVVQVIVGGTVEVEKQHVTPVGPLIFSVLMLVCAVGMWRKRYWAVLGFQALLALVILFFALLLIRASNALGFVIGAAVVLGGGFLFFKLVRVLSRIQMPRYPGGPGARGGRS